MIIYWEFPSITYKIKYQLDLGKICVTSYVLGFTYTHDYCYDWNWEEFLY